MQHAVEVLKLFVFVSQRDLSSLWRTDYETGPEETLRVSAETDCQLDSKDQWQRQWRSNTPNTKLKQSNQAFYFVRLVGFCAGSLDEEEVADLKWLQLTLACLFTKCYRIYWLHITWGPSQFPPTPHPELFDLITWKWYAASQEVCIGPQNCSSGF